MSEATEPLPTYDCLILSGGGAKGAYGAGVAKAIEIYRKHRGIKRPTCYIGASAGALNACILASAGADRLIDFWLETTNRSVLGVSEPNAKLEGAKRWILTTFGSSVPYSIYSGGFLRELIRRNTSLGALRSPIIIACTNYTQGDLTAFYSSDLITALIEKEATAPLSQRRLKHFRKIESDEMLVDVLLASAAIPIFFPPVKITTLLDGATNTSWYVDGGVGNHTPTREAAYFFRYLEATERGRAGMAFCVSQDPPRIIQEPTQRLGLADISKRSMEVYHNVHTKPIVTAWKRINAEVGELFAKLADFENWLNGKALPDDVRAEILDRVNEDFGRIGGVTPRLGVPLVEIEPSVGLGDTLDFDPARARDNIVHGFTDTLKALRRTRDRSESRSSDKTLLDEAEFDALLETRIFPPRTPAGL